MDMAIQVSRKFTVDSADPDSSLDLFTYDDVDYVTKREYGLNNDIIDDEFTRFLVVLNDGTSIKVQVPMNGTGDGANNLFFDAGFAGSGIEAQKLMQRAVQEFAIDDLVFGSRVSTTKQTTYTLYLQDEVTSSDADEGLVVIVLNDGSAEEEIKAFRRVGFVGTVSKLINDTLWKE